MDGKRMPKIEPEFADYYDIKREIGRGAFSVVYLCVRKKDGKELAVKVINKSTVGIDEKTRKRLETEEEILRTVSHPHIIPLYDIIETPKTIYFVMELVIGGELFDKIVEKGFYSEKDASKLVKNVVGAIQYLHENKIAHRDLKPENLLVKGDDDTHIMISDFGLSKVLGDDSMAFTACGTPYYVAPEVVSASGYGKEVDMWSIGVITYFLLAGFPPFMGDSLPEIVEQIINGDYEFPSPYWDNISANARNFVSKLLTVAPEARMSAAQALHHPWLADPDNNEAKPLENQEKFRVSNQKRKTSGEKLK